MEQRVAKILVVDDEAPIRITLRELLRRHGYEVTLAASGQEAIACIDREGFDLLLLDLKLPGISGLEVATYAQGRGSTAPVIILTGTDTRDDASDPARLPGIDFLLKTTSPREVLAHITAATGRA